MMRGSQVSGGTQTTTVQVAGNVDRSGAVLFLGLGLVLVNFVFGSGSPVVSYLDFQTNTPPQKGAVPWGTYVFMLFAVFLLLLLAKTGEVGGNLAVIFLAAAWIVWLLNSPSEVSRIFGQTGGSGDTGTADTTGTNKKA